MKRAAILGIAVLLAGCLVVALGWVGFMTFLQSRVATVSVSVAGGVDEVATYSASDPTKAAASVRTNGQDKDWGRLLVPVLLLVSIAGFNLVGISYLFEAPIPTMLLFSPELAWLTVVAGGIAAVGAVACVAVMFFRARPEKGRK